MINVTTHSAEETKAFAGQVLEEYKTGPLVIALYGDLGAGKTTFTQGLAESLGVTHHVNSPTFLIHKTYKLEKQKFSVLHHFDLYRFASEVDARDVGLLDMISDENAVSVIEWPERVEARLPRNRINIYIGHISDTERKIKIDSTL